MRESGGDPVEHMGAGTSTEFPPLRALEAEPPLADEAEEIFVHVQLKLGQHGPKFIVTQAVVYGSHNLHAICKCVF